MSNRFGVRCAIVGVAAAILVVAPLLAAPQGKVFDSAGTRVHYLEEGQGQTVVLLHGYASNANAWIRMRGFGMAC